MEVEKKPVAVVEYSVTVTMTVAEAYQLYRELGQCAATEQCRNLYEKLRCVV